MIPDTCSCGKGKLRKGTTDFSVNVAGDTIVIKDVPAYVCDNCDEAFFSIETSRKIDEAMRKYRSAKLLTKNMSAGAIELKLNA